MVLEKGSEVTAETQLGNNGRRRSTREEDAEEKSVQAEEAFVAPQVLGNDQSSHRRAQGGPI